MQPRRPVVVEWAGCAGIRKGPVCELGTGRALTLWIADDDWTASKWSLATDRGVVIPRIEDGVEGGRRLTVAVPAGARRVELDEDGGPARWSLTIAEAPSRPAVEHLLAEGHGGKYAEALAGLEALRAGTPPDERGPVDAAIGRMALALGNVPRAEPAFRASIAAATADGRIADVVRDSDALFWAFVTLQQRYSEARTLLEEMTPFAARYPAGRVWLEHDGGLLAGDTADVRTALDKFREAARWARRLGRATMEENAADEVARVLTRVGRSEDAVAIQKRLAAPVDPCARATRTLNLAEALMEQAVQLPSPAHRAEAAAALGAARTVSEACPDLVHRTLAIVDAADYALEAHDDDEARRLVEELEAQAPEKDLVRACRRADVLGRWKLHQRDARGALAVFEQNIPAARALDLLDETFRGEVGAGRALLALGRRGAAVPRLKRAQQLLEQMLRGIPLAEGRGSFLGGHLDGIRYLVGALVEGGAASEALRVARWTRSVELTQAARLNRLADLSPEARRRWDGALERYQRIRRDIERQAEDDWKVPRAALAGLRAERQSRAEQARAILDDAYRLLVGVNRTDERALSSPTDDEAYLAFFPGPEGWFAFVARAGSVTAHPFAEGLLASEQTARAVLSLVGPRLGDARRVRLLPFGAADRLDWQAVVWKDRPLRASMEVEYGLDVGMEAKPIAAAESSRTALVISNPTGDLMGARPEGDAVAKALRGWNVTRLDGPAATREATLLALPKTRLLHYAGHARRSGAEGLTTALILNGDGRVELGDLLASPSVPELVVLSACESASTEAGQPSLMGLAQAFIAAGSRAAIAPTREVRDDSARAFVSAFYAALTPPTVEGKASTAQIRAAFRTATTTLSSRGSAAGDRSAGGSWDSFRLLVP
ncbi:MAG TPA: CHAT domain-containing protein [Polyangia bacterium]